MLTLKLSVHIFVSKILVMLSVDFIKHVEKFYLGSISLSDFGMIFKMFCTIL